MTDWVLVKDVFTWLGIVWVSAKIVTGTAVLYDQIHLRGFKRGVRKWLETNW